MASTRNDIKQYAQQIENLAREIQVRADSGNDLLGPGNELVRNNISFIFTLGELYALEQSGSNTKVTAKVVRAGNKNYHNVRDSKGRFSSKY